MCGGKALVEIVVQQCIIRCGTTGVKKKWCQVTSPIPRNLLRGFVAIRTTLVKGKWAPSLRGRHFYPEPYVNALQYFYVLPTFTPNIILCNPSCLYVHVLMMSLMLCTIGTLPQAHQTREKNALCRRVIVSVKTTK